MTIRPLNIDKMTTRPSRIGADSQRREGEPRRFLRRWDEGPVDEDLKVVVVRVEDDGLVSPEFVFVLWVPPHWGEIRWESWGRDRDERTVVRYGVDPFVQRRVQFSDDLQLEIRIVKAERNLRLVYTILTKLGQN